MKLRLTLAAALCASAFGAVVPLAAQAEVRIFLNNPPPELRQERVPPARRGYTWVPGYWNARNNRHFWQAGRWERNRKGYHYAAPVWVQNDNRWELQRGRWNKGDRDGDGVPNRVDRAPDNPRRN